MAGKKANRERGEHDLALPGKTYRLRPSHSALKAIERETGCSVLALVRLGNVGELSLEQLGIIGAELIRAGADEKDSLTQGVDAERVEELIFENQGPDGVGGLPYAQSVLTLCLLDAATGGRTVSGEARAAPAKKTSQPAGAASPE
jgi:hypothetical protein